MATMSTPTNTEAIQPHQENAAIVPGRPQEQLEIEEAETTRDTEDDIEYPTGAKLWTTLVCLCLSLFLNGLVGDLHVTMVKISD